MIKKTSELVPGEMVRIEKDKGFSKVTFIEQVNGVDMRVGLENMGNVIVPDFYGWEVLESTPKLYRASELKIGEMVRLSEAFEYFPWKPTDNENDDPIWQKQEQAPQTPKLYRASELKVGDMVRLEGMDIFFVWGSDSRAKDDDPKWEKQEQAQSTPVEVKLPTLTNEQLERIVIDGLGQLFLLAKELAPQEPTDLNDFEWGIRYCQNILMARTLWRTLRAEMDKADKPEFDPHKFDSDNQE